MLQRNMQQTMLHQAILHLTMEIKTAVRQFIAENVLLGIHQTTIEDTTPLVSGGLIDSIGMIGLVNFLETRFKVEFVPREIDVHSLNTLDQIDELIRKKLASQGTGAAGTGQQTR
jgi:acyl carrier protein